MKIHSLENTGSISVDGIGILSLNTDGTIQLGTQTVYTVETYNNVVATGGTITNESIGNQIINGDLIVTGSLTAQQFIVSSSVTYLTTSFASGSTKFGDTLDDVHGFTGSLSISGSLIINGASYNTTTSGTSGTGGTSGTNGTAGSGGTSGSSGSSGSSGESGIYIGTSTDTIDLSTLTIGVNKSLTTSVGLSYTIAQHVIVAYSLTEHFHGDVVSYNSGTGVLVLNVTDINTPTGTFSTWSTNLDGAAGGNGTSGTSGTNGTAGSGGTSGSSGVSGASGSSGATGSSGSAGTSGTSGTATTSTRVEENFIATAGQTTFTVTGGYTVGLVDVFVNGVRFLPTEYTATNGTTVVFGSGLLVNDEVTIINYTSVITALPTSRNVQDFTATSGQTTFTVTNGYIVGLLDVYVNGSKLTSSEFTATNGTTFVLTVASTTGDQVQSINYTASVNGVSGAGTTNYVPKFTATGTIGDSAITDNGTTVSLVSRSLSGTSATFTGNLGVGISSFASWTGGTENVLQVKNASVYEYGGYETALSVNAYYNSGWKYIGSNTASQLQLSAGVLSFKSATSGTTGNAITWTTPLTITTSGNVGIGTSSPSQKLHLSDSTSVYCRISNTSGADVYLGSESTQGVLAVNNNYALDIRTNNITRLFINTAGNVGIGITPSSGWSSFTTLQLGGNTYSAVASSNHYLNIAANSYYDGTNFRYISNGFTSRYQLSDGTHLWYVGVSGTTGNAVSYNTSMIITNSGNLGIGASITPVYKLEVSTASGSERIRVGTLQNNNNTATFEAITTQAVSSASSGWFRANAGGTMSIGTSTYTKAGGDSGNFANLSAESQTTAMTIKSNGDIQIGSQDSTVTTRVAISFDAAYPNDVQPSHLSLCGIADSRKRMSLGYDTANNYGWINSGQWGVQWTSLYMQKSGGALYGGSARLDNNSDIRIKDNIQPITGALDKVLSMTGKKFHMMDEPESKIRLGFIAQELQGVVDELVIESDRTQTLPNGDVIENILGLETWGSSWAALLVEAIKELSAKVTLLENN
jgi:hypothetical protein